MPGECSREDGFLVQRKDGKYIRGAQGPREDGMLAHDMCR
jgi:hypothetical protein